MIERFNEGYKILSEKEQITFKVLVNKLISVNYLTAEKEEDKINYYFIISHLEVFESYFEIGGMELLHYQVNKTIVLTSKYLTIRHLNKIGSIILLILRLLYHQKLHDISLDSGIIVSIKDIQEKYEQLNVEGKERIIISELESTLTILKKHNIINYRGKEYRNDDFLITIYPTIIYAVNINNIEELHNRLNSYVRGEKDEEITED